MLLSVSLPNYNHASYLPKRIPSILEALPENSELIIVDDGSTDGSKAIIEQFAQNDPRIVYIDFPKNRGVLEALAAVIQQAEGTFISFLSVDDEILPHFFSTMLCFADAHPNYPLYVSNFGYIKNGEYCANTLLQKSGKYHLLSPEEYCDMSFQGFWIPVHAAIARLEWIKKLGGFNPKLGYQCDWFLYNSIALLAGVAYLPETLSYWRIEEVERGGLHEMSNKKAMRKIKLAFFDVLTCKKNRELRRRFRRSGVLYTYARELFVTLCLIPKYWDWPAYFTYRYLKRKLKHLFGV